MDVNNTYLYFLLPILFFIGAFLYSSVGKGGGSYYASFLHIFKFQPNIIPPTTLSLDLVVASLAFYNYFKAKHFKITLFLPFATVSAPAAFLGGYVTVDKFYMIILTMIAIIISGLLLIFPIQKENNEIKHTKFKWTLALFFSFLIGLNAGITGIAGGVFLSPILILTRIALPKQAAASAGLYILVNSFFGILGHLARKNFDYTLILFLILPVLLGAVLGSYAGAFKFKQITVRKVIGSILILLFFLLFLKDILFYD